MKKTETKPESKKVYDLEKRNIEVKARAEELSTVYGVNVMPFLSWTEETGEVVGYFKEPTLDFEMKCMDLFQVGRITDAGQLILENHLIREESDKRIARENKLIYKGAILFCIGIITYAANLIKKN